MNILSAAVVRNTMAKIARIAGVYSERVQQVAVQCIGHAIAHGDVTLATELLSYVRKHDKHILVSFFEQNGPFRYQKDAEAFEKNKSWVGEFVPENIPHWEKAKKVVAPKSIFDVEEAFARFLTTTLGQIKKAQSTKHAELLSYLKDAQARYAVATFAETEAKRKAIDEPAPSITDDQGNLVPA